MSWNDALTLLLFSIAMLGVLAVGLWVGADDNDPDDN